jgi:hypothetical protein
MVKDATASYSDKEMHAALEVNIPNYASAVVTTGEIVDAKPQDEGSTGASISEPSRLVRGRPRSTPNPESANVMYGCAVIHSAGLAHQS